MIKRRRWTFKGRTLCDQHFNKGMVDLFDDNSCHSERLARYQEAERKEALKQDFIQKMSIVDICMANIVVACDDQFELAMCCYSCLHLACINLAQKFYPRGSSAKSEESCDKEQKFDQLMLRCQSEAF